MVLYHVATLVEAEKKTDEMIHGGVIQEQNGVFHVWYMSI